MKEHCLFRSSTQQQHVHLIQSLHQRPLATCHYRYCCHTRGVHRLIH